MPAPNLITETGRALYGARWFSDMAADLGVSQRTVRRWANGEFNVPLGVWAELIGRAHDRSESLAALVKRIRRDTKI